jgi:hypothetical protein
MTDEPRKFDPFKPAQPRIPGVGDAPAAPAPSPAPAKPAPRVQLPPKWIAIGAAGAVVLGITLAWLLLRPSAPPVASHSVSAPAVETPTSAAGSAAAGSAASTAEIAPIYPDEVAAIAEMATPWASRRFNFLKKVSAGPVPAMLLRLPGGSARSADSYWAFALHSRYGMCDLELVTDLERLRAEFGYRAQHPMVVEPCTGTVFDPLRRATVSGAWVRGDVVQGASLRPPLMIEVQIKGDRILAVQME